MRLLFLGDMVGKTGRTAVWDRLPGLISDLKLDFVIVNGENAAGVSVLPRISFSKPSTPVPMS